MSRDEKDEDKNNTDEEDKREIKGVLANVRLKRRPQSDVFDKYEIEMTFLMKLLGEDWCYELDCKDTINSIDKIMDRLKNIAQSPDLAALIKKRMEE